MLAVGFDQEGGLLFSLCQQIADADLNPRMDMQFRLLTSDDALLAPYRCDHQREELRNPDAHFGKGHLNVVEVIPQHPLVVELLRHKLPGFGFSSIFVCLKQFLQYS
ncbi:hypothetical protein D9M71_575020 [compost metagenome]